MDTNDQTSALLALPVELVGRIADSLTPESLLMFRLTCKALEHSTYDLLAKTFFEQRFCCIYYEPRWLLIDNVVSSRLGSRVQEVTFTAEPLESKWYKDLQLAPNEFEKNINTAQRNAEGELSLTLDFQTRGSEDPADPADPAWPSAAVIHRVFRAFKRLAPRTLFKLEFLKVQVQDDIGFNDLTSPLVKADILVAAVTAGAAIDTLKLDFNDARLLTSVLTYLEPELMASTRSLKCFQVRRRSDEHDPQLVTTILESGNDLRELSAISATGYSMTTAILQVNDFSQLTTLRISGAIFPGGGLAAGLSTCCPLLHLLLADVELSSTEKAWPSVFHTLALMPQLHKLNLFVLRDHAPGHKRLTFRHLTNGKKSHMGDMIAYEGREHTAAGLDELTAAPLLRKEDHETYRLVVKRRLMCSVCVCSFD